MAIRLRTWIWIVVSILVICVLGLIAMAGAGAYYFAKHIKTTEASPAVAERSFDEVKRLFGDQKPLLELDEHGNVARSNTLNRPRVDNAATPDAIHILAYDPDDARVVSVKIPFWLLRLKGLDSNITFNDSDKISLEELKITVEDLEKMGPSLLVDHKSPRGDRVLVWSQ